MPGLQSVRCLPGPSLQAKRHRHQINPFTARVKRRAAATACSDTLIVRACVACYVRGVRPARAGAPLCEAPISAEAVLRQRTGRPTRAPPSPQCTWHQLVKRWSNIHLCVAVSMHRVLCPAPACMQRSPCMCWRARHARRAGRAARTHPAWSRPGAREVRGVNLHPGVQNTCKEAARSNKCTNVHADGRLGSEGDMCTTAPAWQGRPRSPLPQTEPQLLDNSRRHRCQNAQKRACAHNSQAMHLAASHPSRRPCPRTATLKNTAAPLPPSRARSFLRQQRRPIALIVATAVRHAHACLALFRV